MKHHLFLAMLALITTNASAQVAAQRNPLAITGPQNAFKSEIPLSAPSIVGSTYLYDEWHGGEIILKDGYSFSDFRVKIEVEHANIEIEYQKEVKYLGLKDIAGIVVREPGSGDSVLVKRGTAYSFEGSPLQGVVMIYPGTGTNYQLIKNFYAEFIPAHYNVAMDVGSKDHRRVVKEKKFISFDGQLVLIKGSEKKVAAKLGQHKEKALALLKEHKFNFSRDKDIVTFLSLLDS